jgi:hypothetical protein
VLIGLAIDAFGLRAQFAAGALAIAAVVAAWAVLPAPRHAGEEHEEARTAA